MNVPQITFAAELIRSDTARSSFREQGTVVRKNGENQYEIRLPSGQITVETLPDTKLPLQAKVQVSANGPQLDIRLIDSRTGQSSSAPAPPPGRYDASSEAALAQIRALAKNAQSVAQSLIPANRSSATTEAVVLLAHLASSLEPGLAQTVKDLSAALTGPGMANMPAAVTLGQQIEAVLTSSSPEATAAPQTTEAAQPATLDQATARSEVRSVQTVLFAGDGSRVEMPALVIVPTGNLAAQTDATISGTFENPHQESQQVFSVQLGTGGPAVIVVEEPLPSETVAIQIVEKKQGAAPEPTVQTATPVRTTSEPQDSVLLRALLELSRSRETDSNNPVIQTLVKALPPATAQAAELALNGNQSPLDLTRLAAREELRAALTQIQTVLDPDISRARLLSLLDTIRMAVQRAQAAIPDSVLNAARTVSTATANTPAETIARLLQNLSQALNAKTEQGLSPTITLTQPTLVGFMSFSNTSSFKEWFAATQPGQQVPELPGADAAAPLAVRITTGVAGAAQMLVMTREQLSDEILHYARSELLSPALRDAVEQSLATQLAQQGSVDTTRLALLDLALSNPLPGQVPPSAQDIINRFDSLFATKQPVLPPATAVETQTIPEATQQLRSLVNAMGVQSDPIPDTMTLPASVPDTSATIGQPLSIPNLFDSLGLNLEQALASGALPEPFLDSVKAKLLSLLNVLDGQSLSVLPVVSQAQQNEQHAAVERLVTQYADFVTTPLRSADPDDPVLKKTIETIEQAFSQVRAQAQVTVGTTADTAQSQRLLRESIRALSTELVRIIGNELEQHEKTADDPQALLHHDQALTLTGRRVLEGSVLLERQLTEMLDKNRQLGTHEQASQQQLRTQAETLLNRLETLQLSARPQATVDGQQQTVTLPVRVGYQWEDLPVTLVHRRSKRKDPGHPNNHFGVSLAVTPPFAGPTSVSMDYTSGGPLRLNMTFDNTETRRWFDKKQHELETALTGLGFAGVTSLFSVSAAHTHRQPDDLSGRRRATQSQGPAVEGSIDVHA